MKKKNTKKIVMGLGAIAAIATPLATTIACGTNATNKTIKSINSKATHTRTATEFQQATNKLINLLTNPLENTDVIGLQTALDEYLAIANDTNLQNDEESSIIKNLVNQVKKLTESNVKHLDTIKELKEEKLNDLQKELTSQRKVIKTINDNSKGLAGLGDSLNKIIKDSLQKINDIAPKLAEIKKEIKSIGNTIGKLRKIAKSISQPNTKSKTVVKPVVKKTITKTPSKKKHNVNTKPVVTKKPTHEVNDKKQSRVSLAFYKPSTSAQLFNKFFDTETYNRILKNSPFSLINGEDREKASGSLYNNDMFNDWVVPRLIGKGYSLKTKKNSMAKKWFREIKVGQKAVDHIGLNTVTYEITKVGIKDADGNYEHVEYTKTTEDGFSLFKQETHEATFHKVKRGSLFVKYNGNEKVYDIDDALQPYGINFKARVQQTLGKFINDEITRLSAKSFSTPHEIAKIILDKFFKDLRLKVDSFTLDKHNALTSLVISKEL